VKAGATKLADFIAQKKHIGACERDLKNHVFITRMPVSSEVV